MRHTPGRGRCGRSRPTGDHRAPSVGGTGGRVDRAPSVGGTGGRVDRAPSVGGTGGPCRGPPVQQMKRYVLVRALYSVVTLWLLVTIIFGLVRLTGDPVAMKAEAGADPAYVAQLRQSWGLDQPLYWQYLGFVGRLLRADFGHSFEKSLPVRDIYFERLPNSLKLGFAAFLISISLGIPFGMLSALKVNSWWDNTGKMIALFGLSMPGFFVGLVLILVFGTGLGWLPVLGKGSAAFVWSVPSTWVTFWFRDWAHLVMPAFALGWYFSGAMLRITRSGMLDVLGSDYIKLVRLKGVPERMVVARHALKNS